MTTRLKLVVLVLALAFVPVAYSPQWLGIINAAGFNFIETYAYGTPPQLLFLREALPIAFILWVALSERVFWTHRAMRPLVLLFALLAVALITTALGDLGTLLNRAAVVTFARDMLFFALPIAVYTCLVRAGEPRYFRVVLGAVMALLFVNLLVSISQRLGIPYEAHSAYGARTIGITTNPNVAGTLNGIGALTLLYRWRSAWLWFGLYIAFVLGAILTGSRAAMGGTAVVGIAAIWAARQPGRHLATAVALIPLAIALIANLSTLDGRGGTIRILGDERFAAFNAVYRMSAVERFAGRGLGFGTNVGSRIATAARGSGVAPTSDSLLTLSILQFGLAGSVLFFFAVGAFFITFAPPPALFVFLLFFVIFGGLTQNMMEAYPAGMVFGVLLGCWTAEARFVATLGRNE